MAQEMKISLSFYKMVYAVFFIVVLSLIRGVSSTHEIGTALEAPMALLAAVFCADTCTQEITSKRSEVRRLYPMKKRLDSIARRIMIQEVFLSLLAILGYGLFLFFQNPRALYPEQGNPENETGRFLICFAAMVITLVFWGMLSNTFSVIFRNMWMGIGSCLILWLITNSSTGDRYFGAWNLFSYTFRDAGQRDFGWMCGKIVCICVSLIMLAMLPWIIKKRG